MIASCIRSQEYFKRGYMYYSISLRQNKESFCRQQVFSPQPWEALAVACGAGDRVEVALGGRYPVDHQQPGHTVRARVRHHRLQELVHRHLCAAN